MFVAKWKWRRDDEEIASKSYISQKAIILIHWHGMKYEVRGISAEYKLEGISAAAKYRESREEIVLPKHPDGILHL